jgi:tuberous sclerosis protein 2
MYYLAHDCTGHDVGKSPYLRFLRMYYVPLAVLLLHYLAVFLLVRKLIAVWYFFAGIVRIPRMYANFVEEEYLSVFAIALPYTNPFK